LRHGRPGQVRAIAAGAAGLNAVPPAVAPRPFASEARTVTLLLMAAYTCNAMDRGIVSIIGQSMKVDLALTDTELGLVGGTAFAMLYALGGIPIARLAERLSRVNIITAALLAWSVLTVLLGAAATFAQLLAIRVAIGIAEAGCSPPAHSLISDYVAPERRASALSIYSCGLSLGYIAGAVLGGYVALHFGWRWACVALGLPGIGMAFVLRTRVREPTRGAMEPGAPVTAPPPFSWRREGAELRAVARALFLDRPVLNVVIGITVGSFASYGSYAFIPAYFSRAYGLDYGTIGLVVAFAGGVSVGIGIFAGGFITDALARRDARWNALVPAIGILVAAPLYVLAFLQPGWRAAALVLALPGLFQYASLGPTFGIVQNVVDTRRRATASAFLYICLSVLALGGGPLFTGWLIDHYAEARFSATGATEVAAASFRALCPGGHAAAGAAAGLAGRCASALVGATRAGLVVTVLLHLWAAVHYLLAAAGIGRSLAAATRREAALSAQQGVIGGEQA
jgi:predicted MFS family arabinose efflux permease